MSSDLVEVKKKRIFLKITNLNFMPAFTTEQYGAIFLYKYKPNRLVVKALRHRVFVNDNIEH